MAKRKKKQAAPERQVAIAPAARRATPAESAAPLEPTTIAPEQLARAAFLAPATVELEFADGRRFSLAVELLGMPVDRIAWPTLKASPDGDKAIVEGIKGDTVPIGSATLRYLADKEYAAKADAELKSVQFSEEELARIARDNPPPPAWFSQPSRDLARESWK